MKKIIIFLLAVLLSACGPTLQQRVEQLEQQPDVLETLRTFRRMGSCSDYYSHDNSTRIFGDTYFIQAYAKQGANIKCFSYQSVGGGRYVNHSDECILARRNQTKQNKVCFFDYKRFLPATAKIKNDDEFLKLSEYFNRAWRYDWQNNSFTFLMCNDSGMTTEEKSKCRADTRDFIVQIAEGKAKGCSANIRKEYEHRRIHGWGKEEDKVYFELLHLCILKPKTAKELAEEKKKEAAEVKQMLKDMASQLQAGCLSEYPGATSAQCKCFATRLSAMLEKAAEKDGMEGYARIIQGGNASEIRNIEVSCGLK